MQITGAVFHQQLIDKTSLLFPFTFLDELVSDKTGSSVVWEL